MSDTYCRDSKEPGTDGDVSSVLKVSFDTSSHSGSLPKIKSSKLIQRRVELFSINHKLSSAKK